MKERYSGDEVAVIGMSCRFPMSNSPEEFWRYLRAGKELISIFSDHELEGGAELSSAYVKAKGVVEDALYFDTDLFGYSQREATMMDPQHRILLQCAWEVLESAGYDPTQYSGSIGVFVGCNQNSYFLKQLYPFLSQTSQSDHEELSLLVGNSNDYLATRLSFKLNLRGPSKTIQTACSTSLVTVHDACQALLSFECDLALAGGSSISFPLRSGYTYSADSIYSPDGHSRAFDHRACGTVFGDGVGLVALKRLDEAMRDQDMILGVVKGSAVNNDGANKISFLAPSIQGQSKVIAAALAAANVSAEMVSYVEAHGTGTALGDPIEVAALTQAFQLHTKKKQFCALGSVKANVGHLITAAGMASFIKTICMLNHREIPPLIHFEKPNPNIAFSASPFYINNQLIPWFSDSEEPLRAGVSSFGMGGTNAHLILEEPPRTSYISSKAEFYLLPFSAATHLALNQIIQQMMDYLKVHQEISLGDIAFTLQTGRRALHYREFFICEDLNDARDQLYSYLNKEEIIERVPPQLKDIKSSWLRGEKIDWFQLHVGKQFRRIPLPTYPFARVKCMLEIDQRSTFGVHTSLNKKSQTLTEKMVSSLWAHILQEEAIDHQSNFFSLGGDSLTALEVVDHIRKIFCINISLNDFLSHPTVKDLSLFLQEMKSRDSQTCRLELGEPLAER